jgi:hypothetical protein
MLGTLVETILVVVPPSASAEADYPTTDSGGGFCCKPLRAILRVPEWVQEQQHVDDSLHPLQSAAEHRSAPAGDAIDLSDLFPQHHRADG